MKITNLKNNKLMPILIISILLIIVAFYFYPNKDTKIISKQAVTNTQTTSISKNNPEKNEVKNTSDQSETTKITNTIPKTFLNSKVPFALQAPSANWDIIHEEACEETAIVIVKEYYSGNYKDLDSNQNEQKIQEIISWERGNFGYFEDTNIEKNQEILMKMFNIKSEVIENPQINDIKQSLIDNKLILVPSAGRLLRNPYFTGAGPIFHMVVIVGWDENNFIVHDVGTKRGKEYKYPFEILLNANHDLYENAKFPLDAELIKTGPKKILRVYK